MSDTKHAILSPSSAERWLLCPASVLMEKGIPDVASKYAAEGTAAHALAALMLSPENMTTEALDSVDRIHPTDDEMYGYVQTYVDKIKELAEGHNLLVEQKLPIGHVTLEDGAEGTGDAVIIRSDDVIEVNDLKYGMGVKVYAAKNKQMMLYALGALRHFSFLGDFKKVVIRIHQPRLQHYDEWECSIADLNTFADEARSSAHFIWRLWRGEVALRPAEDFCPSENTCRWCKAKATCPVLSAHIANIVAEDFDVISSNPIAKLNPIAHKIKHATNDELAWLMDNVGVVEDWCKAIRAKVESEMLSGNVVPRWKLVVGKKGNRKWLDETAAEEKMKALGAEANQMYETKLVTPAKAEKIFNKKSEVWKGVADLITQEGGRLSVAPITDPRETVVIGATEDDFEVIENNA